MCAGVLDSQLEAAVSARADCPPLPEGGQAGGGRPEFVYPYGATLSVTPPASAVLTSGELAVPFAKPLCALWDGGGGAADGRDRASRAGGSRGSSGVSERGRSGHRAEAGRLCVLGSSHALHDEWISRESNMPLVEIIFEYLMRVEHPVAGGGLPAPPSSSYEGEALEDSCGSHIPDTASLAETVRGCLEDGGSLSVAVGGDLSSLFDGSLFGFESTRWVSELVRVREALGVPREPLSLIPPQFEAPLPPLKPALFAPTMCEPPPPPLELFDLDEDFASDKVQGPNLPPHGTHTPFRPHVTNGCSLFSIRKGTARASREPLHRRRLGGVDLRGGRGAWGAPRAAA